MNKISHINVIIDENEIIEGPSNIMGLNPDPINVVLKKKVPFRKKNQLLGRQAIDAGIEIQRA